MNRTATAKRMNTYASMDHLEDEILFSALERLASRTLRTVARDRRAQLWRSAESAGEWTMRGGKEADLVHAGD